MQTRGYRLAPQFEPFEISYLQKLCNSLYVLNRAGLLQEDDQLLQYPRGRPVHLACPDAKFDRAASHQRRTAIVAHTASTIPNGQAP